MAQTFEAMGATLTEWLAAHPDLHDRREWDFRNQATIPRAGFRAKRLVLVTYEGSDEIELPTTEIGNPDRKPRFVLRMQIHTSIDEDARDHLLGSSFDTLRRILVEEAGQPPFGISGVQEHRSEKDIKTDLGSGFMVLSIIISDL